MSKLPDAISYDLLLRELARRVLDGERPDDGEYFAELLFNLEANQRSLERHAFERRTRRMAENRIDGRFGQSRWYRGRRRPVP